MYPKLRSNSDNQNMDLDPVCVGISQIWPLGRELWDKIFNFEDNTGLLVLKNDHLEKRPLFVNEFSNLTTWNRVMGQNIEF